MHFIINDQKDDLPLFTIISSSDQSIAAIKSNTPAQKLIYSISIVACIGDDDMQYRVPEYSIGPGTRDEFVPSVSTYVKVRKLW